MKLNADVGESFGSWKMGMDEEVIPLIDMANVACGFHASDPMTIDKAVLLVKNNSIILGAHPGYPDLLGFGRRSIKCSSVEIENYIIYQVGALRAFARKYGIDVEYIKPHGALYNDMMREKEVFRGILKAANILNLPVMVLSSLKNEEYLKEAKEFGVDLIFEAFIDRNYDDFGFLVPRSQKNAVIEDIDEMVKRYLDLKNGKIYSINGKELFIKADTICVHGDNEKALEVIKRIRCIK
ncbi:5-oxoprolinase subunit PxpA [Caminibacter profundus]